MSFKNNFYIYHSKDGFILHNFESKESFLLDAETFKKLVDENISDNEEFQQAGLIGEKQEELYDIAVQIYKSASYIQIKELDVNFDFWREYLAISANIISNIKQEEKTYEGAIELLPHRKIEVNYYDLLKKRRTIREFKGEKISKQELSDILFITFGKFHDSFDEEYLDAIPDISWRRSSPSAGGINAVQAYVLIHYVEGLEPGVYYYDGQKHLLLLIKKGINEQDLIPNLLNQEFAVGSAINIITVANYKSLRMKYAHDKAYTFPFLDNGHLIQTGMLTAVALNLQSWMSSAICEEYFAKLFNLQSYQVPLCFWAVGHGYNESLGPKNKTKIRQILEEQKALSKVLLKEKIFIKINKELEEEKSI